MCFDIIADGSRSVAEKVKDAHKNVLQSVFRRVKAEGYGVTKFCILLSN